MNNDKDIVIIGGDDDGDNNGNAPNAYTHLTVKKGGVHTNMSDVLLLAELEEYYEIGNTEAETLTAWQREGHGIALVRGGSFLVIRTDIHFGEAVLTDARGRMICNGSKQECLEYWLTELRKEDPRIAFVASQIDPALMQTMNHKYYGNELHFKLILPWTK